MRHGLPALRPVLYHAECYAGPLVGGTDEKLCRGHDPTDFLHGGSQCASEQRPLLYLRAPPDIAGLAARGREDGCGPARRSEDPESPVHAGPPEHRRHSRAEVQRRKQKQIDFEVVAARVVVVRRALEVVVVVTLMVPVAQELLTV